ncbi:LUD domain-containing protein [uncultured Methylobacterium sp.]|uniref:LutC/YkgG family protein n=1 Tax=uncultured Methylobacterium sp. TaxID=157278 RepID=UPI0026130A0C|nr:LUD domain-containing protein [uncultured Methylobacterium sp.]
MSSRDAILAAIRANRPAGDHPLPEPPRFPVTEDGAPLEAFARNLKAMGGRLGDHDGTGDLGDPGDAVRALFPKARVIASVVPEVTGDRAVTAGTPPQSLADVDVAVVRAAFAIAETGSVLLVDDDLVVNALAYLAQHLVVLVDPADIVASTQDAYRRPDFARHRYAAFHTGPSATADIEGVLIHGAQGVRSLTVLPHPRARHAAE